MHLSVWGFWSLCKIISIYLSPSPVYHDHNVLVISVTNYFDWVLFGFQEAGRSFIIGRTWILQLKCCRILMSTRICWSHDSNPLSRLRTASGSLCLFLKLSQIMLSNFARRCMARWKPISVLKNGKGIPVPQGLSCREKAYVHWKAHPVP